ncbi:hypothetical protein [uncultured Tateyamaria sp.]|uniref:hypothetical protein n=1 Tax=uncultured Tateyamaria sp. TaxID=455651 RepID=UPI002610E96C|nr:hypothetical protein [uncultured Tateyamaria sp.]
MLHDVRPAVASQDTKPFKLLKFFDLKADRGQRVIHEKQQQSAREEQIFHARITENKPMTWASEESDARTGKTWAEMWEKRATYPVGQRPKSETAPCSTRF